MSIHLDIHLIDITFSNFHFCFTLIILSNIIIDILFINNLRHRQKSMHPFTPMKFMYKRPVSFHNKEKLKIPFQTILAYNLHKPFVHLYIKYQSTYRHKTSHNEIYTTKIGKKSTYQKEQGSGKRSCHTILFLLFKVSLCTQYSKRKHSEYSYIVLL